MMPVLVIFGLVIGGIYFGFFNPTPAAAVGVFLVLGLRPFAAQAVPLDISALTDALKETAKNIRHDLPDHARGGDF